MELTFREWLEEDRLIESFDRNTNYKRLSKSEELKYFCKYFKNDTTEDVKLFLMQLSFLKSYYFKNEGREYLIYSFIDNTILEVHFHDINSAVPGSENDNKGLTKNSQPVFSVVLDIVLNEIDERPSRKIRIVAPNGRESLYKKIIDKTLKKYDVDKTIKYYITLDGENVKHNFLLEKEQNKICIGIE